MWCTTLAPIKPRMRQGAVMPNEEVDIDATIKVHAAIKQIFAKAMKEEPLSPIERELIREYLKLVVLVDQL